MSFRLPEPLVDQLKTAASVEGISMTELIARYSRVGLNLSAGDPFHPMTTMLEAASFGESSSSFQYQNHAIVPTRVCEEPAMEGSENHQADGANTASSLLRGFEKFILLLEKALTESDNLLGEEIREDMLDTIGDLSKLKVRLRSEPYLKTCPQQAT